MLKENLMLIAFFILGLSFIIFGIIRGVLIRKLRTLLKKKYNKIHQTIFLGLGPFFIYRPIRLFRYLHNESSYPKDVLEIVKEIRLFSKLMWLFFILTIISPLLVEILF